MARAELLPTGYSAGTMLAHAIRITGREEEKRQPATAALEIIQEVTLADEVPVAIVYNGRSHVVVMATPLDLEDLATGFSITEGAVERVDEVERVDVVRATHGIELQVQIPIERSERLQSRTRNLMARTGCGLCGVESIADVLRVPSTVPHTLDISRDALFLAGHELSARQTLNNETNTVHAAAWANQFGEIELVREDVGRHNALDKLLGAMLRASMRVDNGFVVITSRASYEMIQKAAFCGVELVAAVSRPTGLAVRFAQETGVTLVGLLRGTTANVYTNPQRIS